MKVAQAKLQEIGPDDMNMEEYKVKSLFKCAKQKHQLLRQNVTILCYHRLTSLYSLPPENRNWVRMDK